jgi:anti-sigma B factor antagonist
MEIRTITQQDAVSILILKGELDASNAVQVDSEIIEIIKSKPRQLLVDGNELSYISSAGLGVFLSHLQTFQNLGITLAFYGLNQKIKNVFNILGLHNLVPILNTQEEALAGLEK